MATETYQELITSGIRDLPEEALAEIADFVYFVRKRALEPAVFEDELRIVLLRTELDRLSMDEQKHLEQEFEGYDRLYPLE